MSRSSSVLLELFGPLLATGVAVIALIVVAFWIRSRWREGNDLSVSAHELLTEYRDLRRRGELTEEEFRFIKGRLAPQLGTETTPAAAPGSPTEGSGASLAETSAGSSETESAVKDLG